MRNRDVVEFLGLWEKLHNPDFIILDEPFSGLDPVRVEELEKPILKLKADGKTIIFSSHIMEHVENLCDDILLINHGEVLLQGKLSDIISNYKIGNEHVSSLNDIFIKETGNNEE